MHILHRHQQLLHQASYERFWEPPARHQVVKQFSAFAQFHFDVNAVVLDSPLGLVGFDPTFEDFHDVVVGSLLLDVCFGLEGYAEFVCCDETAR